jgi:uncharacterized Zn finger protein
VALRLDVPVAGFGQADLWQLAGRGAYERGEHYVDAVMDLRDVPDGVRAIVEGSEPYQVQLSWAGGKLVGYCSCPAGSAGPFCKHCVAVGLVLIDEAESEDAESDSADSAEDGGEPLSEDYLREYLESLDNEALVDLLCDHADSDDMLHLKLTLRAAGDRETPDMAVLRRQIYSSLRTRSPLSYEGGLDYASYAGNIVEALDDLLDAGHAAAVAPLAKQVIDLVDRALERAGDSAEEIGSVYDLAVDVHKRACDELPGEDREALVDDVVAGPAPLAGL